ADTAKAPKTNKDASTDSSQVINPTEDKSGSVKVMCGKFVSLGLVLALVAMM
ncbi:fasciclin-like arabinogalactan protein, partial [Trifolium medium]|nr:fasciclin-like arabinogalactan protein [Trifolium medium]